MAHLRQLIIIRRIEDIPRFANEDEENEFWAPHRFSDELIEQAQPFDLNELPPARPASAPSEVTADTVNGAVSQQQARTHDRKIGSR